MFKELFINTKPIIGMIHLPPLPGYPKHPGMEYVIHKALADLKALQKGGFDGALVENDSDQPHQIGVNKTIKDAFERVMREIKKVAVIPIGMEIIYDMMATIEVAHKVDAHFARLDVFVDNVETKWGKIFAQAAEILEQKKKIGAKNLALLTDIHVKHAQMLDKKSLEQSAKEAIHYNSDALIITGNWTGQKPRESDFQSVRKVSSTIPLLVGSGLNHENAKSLLEYSDGAIVGTSIKIGDFIDFSKAKRLIEIINKIRTDL